MKSLFLDTAYLLALELSNDQNHQAAVAHWSIFSAQLPPLVTTTYVFDEVVTFLNSRRQHAKAVPLGGLLLSSPAVELVHVDQRLFEEGWRLLFQHHDKTYSLTGCISFVVMRDRGIVEALSFD